MNKKTPLIQVRDLHQRFGDHHVLRGVTAEVYEGETLVLLGGSGGGKSVLVKHFLGLLSPHSGDVIVEGENISNMKEEIKIRVDECLKIVKLEGQIDKMPADLSGGMRKRVALARAIVDKPKCVLYDEPHAGLDPITADSIDHLIKRLQTHEGITNVIITHEMRSVFRIADRVIFLKEGQIYWQGTPQEMKNSKDPELADFINGISREHV